MLQRKLTRTLEPRMIWWALQNRSGRNWKRITTVYKRILILYTKKWATNSTKQLKKWKEYQREWPQVGEMRTRSPYSKQADRGGTVPDFLELGKKRKGRFQTPYTRIWIHWEDQAVYTAPHMKPASSCTVLITSPLGERFAQLHSRHFCHHSYTTRNVTAASIH